MKLHACRHCGARIRRYTELQEHLKTHPNVCVTCYRVFSNRSILLAHTCKVGEYLCEICQRSYSTQTKLARHKRETSCRHSLPPEAKRQKLMPPIEDLEAPPPLVDEYGSELQDVIIQNWGSIRTHTSHGPVQSRYNIRLMTSDIGGLELGHIFAAQTTAFKINISYGFILRNRTSGRYRYYHSSCNCCGRFSRARFIRDDVHSRASRANLLLREAQSTSRRSQHGASGCVKGRDHQTTIHLHTWIRVGNILSRASSPDRLVAVRQRLLRVCYEMLPQ